MTVLYLPHMKGTQMKRITGYVVFKIDREGVRGGGASLRQPPSRQRF